MSNIRGLDLDKLVKGIRVAVIDDLIQELQNLKLEIKKVDTERLAKKLEDIFK